VLQGVFWVDNRGCGELLLLLQLFFEEVCVDLEVLQRRFNPLINLILKHLNGVSMQVHVLCPSLVPFLEHLVVFFLFLEGDLYEHAVLVGGCLLLLVGCQILLGRGLLIMRLIDLLFFLLLLISSEHLIDLLMAGQIVLEPQHLGLHLSAVLFLGVEGDLLLL